MGTIVRGLVGGCGAVLLNAASALANEASGKPPDYSGISAIYYTFIALVLVYGVYDTFFKKS
jgi:hypothetical protein